MDPVYQKQLGDNNPFQAVEWGDIPIYGQGYAVPFVGDIDGGLPPQHKPQGPLMMHASADGDLDLVLVFKQLVGLRYYMNIATTSTPMFVKEEGPYHPGNRTGNPFESFASHPLRKSYSSGVEDYYAPAVGDLGT